MNEGKEGIALGQSGHTGKPQLLHQPVLQRLVCAFDPAPSPGSNWRR